MDLAYEAYAVISHTELVEYGMIFIMQSNENRLFKTSNFVVFNLYFSILKLTTSTYSAQQSPVNMNAVEHELKHLMWMKTSDI